MTNAENNVAAQAGDEPMRAVITLAWKWHDAAVTAGFASSEPAQELFELLGWPYRFAAPRATADVERDASRWRALLDSERIRMIGSAGIANPQADNYAHFGMEIWTTYGTSLNAEQAQQMVDGNVRGREWITKYADIAIEAQRATTKPGA